MRGPALVGYEPAQIRWSYDSQSVFFQWKQSSDKPSAPLDTYMVGRDGSPPRKLSDAEAKQAPPAFGQVSRDQRLTVYSRDGDLFVYDSANGQVRQITNTTEAEADPHFLPDGKRIYFTRGGNLYVMSLETGYLEQMTDVRAAGAPSRRQPASQPDSAGAVGAVPLRSPNLPPARSPPPPARRV